jgi:hypothetical protein
MSSLDPAHGNNDEKLLEQLAGEKPGTFYNT